MRQNSASGDIWSSQLHSSIASSEKHVQQGEKDRRSSQRIKESFTLIKPNSSIQNHKIEDNMTQVDYAFSLCIMYHPIEVSKVYTLKLIICT